MKNQTVTGDNGLANHTFRSEIVSGYNTLKATNRTEFWFDLPDGIRVWIEKDYGMWQMSITRNWESRTNPGEELLDRRAFNIDENHKTMRWSSKVVDRAVELIEKTIA